MERTPEYNQLVERDMRNRLAPDFDARYIRDKGFWFHKTEVDSIVSALTCMKDDIVFDAGAGTGRISIPIAPKVRRLVCVDFSEESISLLREKLSPNLYDRVHCIVADLNNLPVQKIRFDKIVSVQVIQHVPSHCRRLSVLRSFHGLLKKGGRLAFTVSRWNGAVRTNKEGYYGEQLYRYAFESDEVKTLAEEAGFTGVCVRPLIVQHLRLQRFGLWTTYLDRMLARFLNPKQFGQFLLVTARKE